MTDLEALVIIVHTHRFAHSEKRRVVQTTEHSPVARLAARYHRSLSEVIGDG
jgi:hypothetical protein